MRGAVERLASSLLFEGYALYPYTPEAAKNATPTPFGIVYPPAYADAQPAAYDHLQIECVAVGCGAGTELEAELLFLQGAGERHQATERRIAVSARLKELYESPLERSFAFEPASELGVATGAGVEGAPEVLSGTLRVSAERLGEGATRVRARVENTTPLPAGQVAGLARAPALRRALLSTHAMLAVSDGRFVSPLEDAGETGGWVQACENVNSWPVLADPEDRAVLGAAILLPDHPRIAFESQTSMFDNTEIEEALTLHVQTLSDSERAAIAEGDPAVREMIERVERTTPDQLLRMHGAMKPAEPGLDLPDPPAFPEWREPGSGDAGEPAAGAKPDQVPGERDVVVGGKAFRRGDRVVLRPGTGGDPYDTMLDGRRATIRRIYVDYDGRAYLGVTVDDDPMAEILRDSGRFLFFFADELEPSS